MSKQAQGTLEPVSLPWMVSPSVSGILLFVTENGNAIVRLDVAMLPEANALRAALSNARVDVSFEGGQWVRTFPALDDVEVLPKGLYEMSLPDRFAAIPIDEHLAELRRAWVSTGVCPDSSIFEVRHSEWLRESGAARFGCVHHVIVGHDMWLEILSKGMSWQLSGEALAPSIETATIEVKRRES